MCKLDNLVKSLNQGQNIEVQTKNNKAKTKIKFYKIKNK